MLTLGGHYEQFDSHYHYLHGPNDICSLINCHRLELDRLRHDAFERVLKIFQANPRRVYKYHWPEANEWDSELYISCPTIKYHVSGPFVKNGGFVDGVMTESLCRIFIDDNMIMAETNRDIIPVGDVINIEVVLESIIGSKDKNSGIRLNGFYYEDHNE